MALTPIAPTLSTLTTSGFKIDVNADGNPAGTFYAFRVVVNSETKFIDASGQLQDTEAWLNVTTLTLSGSTPNEFHTVDLKAADDGAGLNESAFGPTATATTLAATPTASPFTDTSSTTATADWGANSNPDGTEYWVELSTDSSFVFGVTNSGWITDLGHTFSSLLPSTTYYARVKARNSVLAETSYVSLGATTTIAGPDTVKAIHVFDLVAERGFLIKWKPNLETNIDGYNVYRSSSPTDSAEFNKLNSTLVPANVQSYIDRIPYTFGVVWYYKVTAVDDGGNESSLDLTTPVHDNTFHSFEEQPFPINVQAGDFVHNEVPQGDIDGVNVLYTTQFPYRPNSVEIFQDGVKLRATIDYDEGPLSQQITLNGAPLAGSDLRVNYIKFGSAV